MYEPQLLGVNHDVKLRFLIDPNFKPPIIEYFEIYKLRKSSHPALGSNKDSIYIPTRRIEEIRILTLYPQNINQISLKGYEIYGGRLLTSDTESIMEELTSEARDFIKHILLQLHVQTKQEIPVKSAIPFLFKPTIPLSSENLEITPLADFHYTRQLQDDRE